MRIQDNDVARLLLQAAIERRSIVTSKRHPKTVAAQAMNRVNPLYVLRNHLAEEAIRAAKAGDASEIDTLMKLLRAPFVAQAGYERYAGLPPDWAGSLEVSCSS